MHTAPQAFRVRQVTKLLGKQRTFGETIDAAEFAAVSSTVMASLLNQGVIEPVDTTPDRVAALEESVARLVAQNERLIELCKSIQEGQQAKPAAAASQNRR